jgi:hypothetical protein
MPYTEYDLDLVTVTAGDEDITGIMGRSTAPIPPTKPIDIVRDIDRLLSQIAAAGRVPRHLLLGKPGRGHHGAVAAMCGIRDPAREWRQRIETATARFQVLGMTDDQTETVFARAKATALGCGSFWDTVADANDRLALGEDPQSVADHAAAPSASW